MVGVNCFLIAVVLWLGTSVAEGSNCDCKCNRKYNLCDTFNNMRGEVDLNIAEIRKWSRYFPSVRTYHTTWATQSTWIEHLEKQVNETADSCLASHRQLEESVQKNNEGLQNVQLQLLHTMKNMALSLEALRKDVDDVKVIMQNDIGQLKQELSRIQTLCSPPCENGGQCVKNVCNCPPSFTGERCQQAVCSPPCKNGGECMKENVCNCTPLFAGDRCQDVMCSPACENGGQCMTNNTCKCPISFVGDRCQQAVCSPPCENGGECMKNNICRCPSSFTGDRCQEDACSPRCKNGGQCLGKNVCKCASSFYGDRCEGGPKCGIDFNNGEGNTSNVLVWPWMAAVYRTSDNAYRCGGSIIHRHFVLTSAWCVATFKNAELSVKLGFSDLQKGTPHLQEYRVQSTHLHPDVGRYNYDYDIGLLELEEEIQFGPFVRPVCLPPPEIPRDDTMYKPQSTVKAVVLYEYLSSPETASPTVLNLTVLSREECRRIKKEKGWEGYFPSQNLSFCTESSSTTCRYYGSPLMESRLAEDGTRTWTQVGITGWYDCRYFFSPRINHLRAWVDATIASKG